MCKRAWTVLFMDDHTFFSWVALPKNCSSGVSKRLWGSVLNGMCRVLWWLNGGFDGCGIFQGLALYINVLCMRRSVDGGPPNVFGASQQNRSDS